jgi:hypothetical protein
MKKILAILVLVLFGTMSYAQWNPGPGNLFMLTPGNVGIGTAAPTQLLHVTSGNTGVGTTILSEKQAGAGGAQFMMSDIGQNSVWLFKSANGGIFKIRDAHNLSDVMVLEPATPSATPQIYLKTNGNLGIGTTNPLAKLSVNGTGTFNGKVKCTEIEVLVAAWPDNVFKTGYTLRPLSEVEEYINVNKHLPDVPGEDAILANGANLGEMNATLLKKVEELTLYMIQLKKDNDALKARISKLEK